MDTKTQVETKLSDLLNQLNNTSYVVINSMGNFHGLWTKIFYEDYAKNDFRLFKSQDSLHMAIHAYWKERNDTSGKIQEILERIMNELNIAKIMNVFDKFVIEEIGQEIEAFSKTATDFETDRYFIQQLIKTCQKHIIQEMELKRRKEEALKKQQQQQEQASTKGYQAKGRYPSNNMSNNEDNYGFFTDSKGLQAKSSWKKSLGSIVDFIFETPSKYTSTKDLINDLSILSSNFVVMNSKLRHFDQVINEIIEEVKKDFIDTDFSRPENTKLQVENLVSVIKKVQFFFNNIHRDTSTFQSQAVLLVLKSNPRSLINQ